MVCSVDSGLAVVTLSITLGVVTGAVDNGDLVNEDNMLATAIVDRVDVVGRFPATVIQQKPTKS